ncbi:hypothetical protein HYS31_06595 [Candidatus Woesearchaeota archaeon]|nr:hypothetical protein [Candidatus Woesearchaeota archaeon]
MSINSKDYVKICPKCGSTDIHLETRIIGGYSEGSGGNFCRNCSYGVDKIVIFPEIKKSKIKEFIKEIKNKKLN